jgi:undecaprenyl-phosphate 4-deoxy-4-formamido-L-arabinose transferase
MKKVPFFSVIVPVFNEEANIPELLKRLKEVMESLNRPYEMIFVNDGSIDKTAHLLEKAAKADPTHVRVIDFTRNYGQHMAIMAGFELSSGEYAMTLDADLQNPPEEIPKIVALIDQGHDYVGSFRIERQDNWFRTYVSKAVNWVRSLATSAQMRDHGCMLRAYHKHIVHAVISSRESSTLVPVLAYTYASSPAEVGIEHQPRQGDKSKYNLYKLARMNFDLFTGFSLLPLQIFTFLGLGISFLSAMLVIYMMARRFVLGAEAEGVFTLFAILFFLVSFVLAGIGILGEYIGRMHQIIQERPRYLIRRILKSGNVIPFPHLSQNDHATPSESSHIPVPKLPSSTRKKPRSRSSGGGRSHIFKK